MIGAKIDIFRNTTAAANRKLVRKSKIQTSTRDRVSIQNLMLVMSFFKLRHCAAKCLRSLHSKQRENEKLPVKSRSF